MAPCGAVTWVAGKHVLLDEHSADTTTYRAEDAYGPRSSAGSRRRLPLSRLSHSEPAVQDGGVRIAHVSVGACTESHPPGDRALPGDRRGPIDPGACQVEVVLVRPVRDSDYVSPRPQPSNPVPPLPECDREPRSNAAPERFPRRPCGRPDRNASLGGFNSGLTRRTRGDSRRRNQEWDNCSKCNDLHDHSPDPERLSTTLTGNGPRRNLPASRPGHGATPARSSPPPGP